MMCQFSKIRFVFMGVAFFFAFTLFAASMHSHKASESKLHDDCAVCHFVQNSKTNSHSAFINTFSLQLVSSPVIFAKLSHDIFTVPLVKLSQAPPVA